MVEFVRKDASYSKSFIVSQGTLISDCLVLFLIYAFLNNYIFHKKINFSFIFVCLPYVLHILANDSRTNVLKFICLVFIILLVLLKKKDNWSTKDNLKIIVFGIVGLLVFVAAFRFLGNRTGVTEKYDLIHNISKYVSSSLIGLDNKEMCLSGIL